MTSEDRNRFEQPGNASDDRGLRHPGVVSPDTDALEAVRDVTSGKGRRDEVERPGAYASPAVDALPPEPRASENEPVSHWIPEPNIVPEGERSER